MTDVNQYTGVKRRRKWSVEEKRQLIEETYLPGYSVSQLAKKYNSQPIILLEANDGRSCNEKNKQSKGITAKHFNLLMVSSKKMYLKILITLILSVFLFFASKKSWDLYQEDRIARQFLDHVMLRQSGIYTLLGSKPMSVIDMSYKPPTRQQRMQVWNDHPSSFKEKYSPEDLYFPSYDAPHLRTALQGKVVPQQRLTLQSSCAY